MTITDQPEGFPLQCLYRMTEQAELVLLLPATLLYILLIGQKVSCQCQNKPEYMLADRSGCVIFHIAYFDAIFSGTRKVNIVGAGRDHADQFQPGQAGKVLSIQFDLIGDNDFGMLGPFYDFLVGTTVTAGELCGGFNGGKIHIGTVNAEPVKKDTVGFVDRHKRVYSGCNI